MPSLSNARPSQFAQPSAQRVQCDTPSADNSQILASMEATGRGQDTGFLDGVSDFSFGSFMDDSRPTHTTDDHLTGRRGFKEFPKRWEDGTLRIPRPAQRELTAQALVNGKYTPLDTQNLDGRDTDSPMHYFDPWGRSEDCATATYTMLEKMGYVPPRGAQNSVLKAGDIGRMHDGTIAEMDEEAARTMVDTVDEALLAGHPAMVGVDYHGGEAPNADQVTDHWFVIVGRTYDPVTGEVQYVAADNADSSAPMRTFTVGEDYSMTSDPPEEATGAAGSTYTASNVRVPERKQ